MASTTTTAEREHTCHLGPTCYDEQAELDGKYDMADTCTHESCQQIEHDWTCRVCLEEDAVALALELAANRSNTTTLERN